MSGVFLSRGSTRAIFASLEKTPFDMLLFIVFDNGAAKTPAANLTIFGGILPKPEVFLALTSLSSFLTSSIVVYGWYRRYMLVLKIFLNLLKTWMIFKILFCYLYNNPFVFNIVVTCDMS